MFLESCTEATNSDLKTLATMLQQNEDFSLPDIFDSESTRTNTESSTEQDSSVSLTDTVAPQGAIRTDCVQNDGEQREGPKQSRRASLTEMFSRSFRRIKKDTNAKKKS